MANQELSIAKALEECRQHLIHELLPFWTKRTLDEVNGGFITHFDQDGNDTGLDEKSMLGQARSIYVYSSAYRHGYAIDETKELASKGVDFLLDKMWDDTFGGCYWLTDRAGIPLSTDKILYGHSFIIYALSEYTLATGDQRGLEYASKTFDLIQKHCVDTHYGGYFEMFSKDWSLKGKGPAGGDRKTLGCAYAPDGSIYKSLCLFGRASTSAKAPRDYRIAHRADPTPNLQNGNSPVLCRLECSTSNKV